MSLDTVTPAEEMVRSWTEQHCWSSSKQALTFYAGTEELDAAVLLGARTGFLAGDDPLHGGEAGRVVRRRWPVAATVRLSVTTVDAPSPLLRLR